MMGSHKNADKLRLKYGPATSIVGNMLLEIKSKNKDTKLAGLIEQCCDVANGQNEYVNQCVFPETKLQRKIATDTVEDSKASQSINMLSGHMEGNFLKMMAEMSQARHILEIGMFTGYSAVTFAESSFCEEMISLDIEPYYESFLKSRLAGTSIEDKVRIMIGPADESLERLHKEGKQFDFIFIDAIKGGYPSYYKFIMDKKLLKPTGTIVCDNILWYGKTFNQASETGRILHEFVEFVKNDERLHQIILPIRDGILMIKPNACLK